MSKALKSTLIIGGTLVAIIVVVVGGLELLSHRLHDDPAATLTFATSAKALHDRLDPDILADFTALSDRVAVDDPSVNATEVQFGITHGSLAASSYREWFGYLQPTPDALDLYTSLRREASSIITAYGTLNTAWSARQAGNADLAATRLAEARAAGDEAVTLRQQNSAALDDLIASARAKLGD